MKWADDTNKPRETQQEIAPGPALPGMDITILNYIE
jgi:hypothetical protein